MDAHNKLGSTILAIFEAFFNFSFKESFSQRAFINRYGD